MQGCTLQCQSSRTDSLHHGLQGYSTGMGFVVWNIKRKRKKKERKKEEKKELGTSNKESKVT
jgi:hypothetical protein